MWRDFESCLREKGRLQDNKLKTCTSALLMFKSAQRPGAVMRVTPWKFKAARYVNGCVGGEGGEPQDGGGIPDHG